MSRWKSVAMGLALSVAVLAAHADGALRFQPLHAGDVQALLRTPRRARSSSSSGRSIAATAARTSPASPSGGAPVGGVWMW